MLAMPSTPAEEIEAVRLLDRERTLFSVTLKADAIPDTRLTDKHRRMLTYWRTKLGRYDAPCRADIDPCDLAPVLPNILLWDIDGTPDYRCRLAGTEVCDNMTGKMQGVLLGDLPCPLIAEARREFDAARDHGLATLAERSLHWLGRPLVFYRHLLLPLVNDQGRRHMLLGVMTFHRAVGRPV
ncbi:MAG TPA: PAS domain-containing protein [Aliidongia sp.]|nr:PAS domain-containing protein [Aliidongia sp.]